MHAATLNPAFTVTFELAVSQVAIENVAAKAGDKNILPAVIVVIHDRNCHAPAFVSETGGLGDITEMKVAVLMIEGDHGIAALFVTVDRRAVHHNDVEFAAVIAVDKSDAPAHGFDDIALVRRGKVRDGNPSFLGYILETRNRRRRRRSLSEAGDGTTETQKEDANRAHGFRSS